MTERPPVELQCAVYGEGSVFPVTIACNSKVSDLQKAVADILSTQEHSVPARLVTLYLAQKNGVWLKADPTLKPLLKQGRQVNSEYVVEMIPVWKLNKTEYFGDNFQPGEEEIHILVELPESTAGVVSESSGLQGLIESSVRKVMVEQEEKRSVYSLSDLNSIQGQRIMQKMSLRLDYFDFDEPVDTSIAGYHWIPNVAESEVSQREGYMAYLRLHFKTLLDRGDFQLVDVTHDNSLLSIVDPRLPFRMNGTADVLLVNRRVMDLSFQLAGIRLVIELKKNVKSSHFAQALGQLVSSSLKAPLRCYPISLLTDLNNHWHFSWFNDKNVLAKVLLKCPKNAIDFAVAMSERDGVAPFRVPFIEPPLKKLNIDDFLPMPYDGADEMMERYELMADELEPEFLAERRNEYAQHLVQSMPIFAHMYA